MRTLMVSELVFDLSIYPRREVDGEHVFNMAEALKANAEFPPIVICKASRRIVDGFHRCRALQRVCGANAEVQVIEKSYKNDRELFLDSIKYNASHGRNLTRDDRAVCAKIADKLGVDAATVAATLKVSPAMFGALSAAGEGNGELTPTRKSGLAAKTHQARKHEAKEPQQPSADRREAKNTDGVDAMEARLNRCAEQLIDALENLWEPAGKLMGNLEKLHELLCAFISDEAG